MSDETSANQQRLRVVLVETQLAANIGSAARAMKTMGLTRMVLVAPLQFPHANALALAAGADDVLDQALVVDSLVAGIADCHYVLGCSARTRGVELPTLTPREAARKLLEQAALGEVAVVFGSERVGLSNADLSRCDAAVQIPSDPAFSSLNLAQAVQVLAYELRQHALEQAMATAPGAVPAAGEERVASKNEMEGFFNHLEATLAAIDFLKGRSPRVIMQRLRRLFLRATPSQREVLILRGILSEAVRQAKPLTPPSSHPDKR
jgi:tRNA (cytidine32/uridine32-2'-O)-methyltransferase